MYFSLDSFCPYRYNEWLDITFVYTSSDSEQAILAPLVAPRVNDQLKEKTRSFRYSLNKFYPLIPNIYPIFNWQPIIHGYIFSPSNNPNRMITRFIKLGNRRVLVYSRFIREKVLINFHGGWNVTMNFTSWGINNKYIQNDKNQNIYLAQGPMLKFLSWYRSRCPIDKPARPCTIPFEEDSPEEDSLQLPSSFSFAICTVRARLSTDNTVRRPGCDKKKKKMEQEGRLSIIIQIL